MFADVLSPGTAINNEYRVLGFREDLTTQDSVDLVYEGRNFKTQKLVFLRIYRELPDPVVDRDMRARFIQAARSVSRLSHPGSLHILDYGLCDDGTPFMVQQYFPGQTLKLMLGQKGKFFPSQAISLMCGCLEALKEAHDGGVVNRGLEPQNLLVTHPDTPDARLRILNFGSIFLEDSEIERMTRTGDLVGAALYLAPEYIEHGEITSRLDVYQMGLILIEMLSGTPAVSGEEPMACVLAHTQGRLNIPDWIRAGPLHEVIDKAVKLDWRERFEDAGAFLEALQAVEMTTPDAEINFVSQLKMSGLIGGQYELIDELGEGGFAKVYRGRHIRTHQPVAVKIMRRRPDMRLHNSFKKRFEIEARASAAVSHPNIVSIYHYGVTGDVPFIVMELLEGHDLEEELKQRGGMDPSLLMPLFIEALDALGVAHRHKVVHKDLKPANLFLTHPDKDWRTIKILDFGIARMGEGEESKLTQTGRMLFTCNYVAPEYIEHQIAVPQTDVYQMGLILIELLTGAPVVAGEKIECIMAHMKSKFSIPDPIKEGALWPVVKIALSKDHTQRYADATAFAAALRQIDPATILRDEGSATARGEDYDPEKTILTDVSYLKLMHHYRQLEHLHEQHPDRVVEIQEHVIYCLNEGNWSASSPELEFLERVVSKMAQTLTLDPSLGDTDKNRRLMAMIWNKRNLSHSP